MWGAEWGPLCKSYLKIFHPVLPYGKWRSCDTNQWETPISSLGVKCQQALCNYCLGISASATCKVLLRETDSSSTGQDLHFHEHRECFLFAYVFCDQTAQDLYRIQIKLAERDCILCIAQQHHQLIWEFSTPRLRCLNGFGHTRYLYRSWMPY